MTRRLLTAALVVAATLVAVGPAQGAARGGAGGPDDGLRRGAGAEGVPRTVTLPGDAAASAVRAHADTWLVGTRPGAGELARAHGARHVAGQTYAIARGRARAFAAALRARDLLAYAEPDRLSARLQAPAPDPLSPGAGWRDRVVGGAVPPAVGPESPLIALVDSMIDVGHPELQGGNITTVGGQPLVNVHGTATATVAAAPANGVGILGIWPGARVLNVPLPTEIGCADSARQIAAAVDRGASVISMSYGSRSACRTEYEQLQRAVSRGIIPVAAAGNEFAEGNPLEFPGSLPHVLTVAAVGDDDRATFFSNRSAAIDLGAPGESILAGIPVGQDRDGTPDGFATLTGTSFSAPMVAAAAAWVRAARPDLTPDQVVQVIRLGARDVGARGWEPATGFGVLSVPRALARAAPPPDPLEPNDDIEFVDGRALGERAPLSFSGRRTEIVGLLDRFEDPIDVYRIKLPPHSRVCLSSKPRYGDPDLHVLSGRARSIESRRVLGRSRRRGDRRDRVVVENTSRHTIGAYVWLDVNQDARSLDSGYRLTITRR